MKVTPSEEQLAVIRIGAEWRLLRNGRDGGHFDYQVDAIEAALRHASEAKQAGRPAEVLVQDSAGRLDRMSPPEGHRSWTTTWLPRH